MAGATLTTLTNILKEFYLPPVVEQLNNEVLAMQILSLDSKNIDLVGLEAVVPLHTTRSGGVGSRGELETLPTAGSQAYSVAKFKLKYHYGVIQVSGQSINQSKSGAGAFLQAYQSELDGIKNDLMYDFGRQVYGDGSGKVATCGTGGPSTTVNLSSAEAVTKGLLYVGMVIDIGPAATPTSIVAADTISDVSIANSTITIATTVTTSSSDFVYRSGNNVGGTIREMDAGLQALIATSANTVGGIDSSAAGNHFWQNQFDNAAGAVSLTGAHGLLLMANKVFNQGARPDQLVILTTPGIARQLFESSDFKSAVRFVNSKTLDGGYESISFSAGSGQMNLVTDRLAPWGSAFYIPKASIKMFSPGDWDFLAKDGQAVKWVQNKDAFQSILFRYANLGTNKRSHALVQYGLTDTGF